MPRSLAVPSALGTWGRPGTVVGCGCMGGIGAAAEGDAEGGEAAGDCCASAGAATTKTPSNAASGGKERALMGPLPGQCFVRAPLRATAGDPAAAGGYCKSD